MSCHDLASQLVRFADEPESLDRSARTLVEDHLADCAACRAALETQRTVSGLLRSRPADRLSPEFAAQLAQRLDEASGWFGIADWRAWTLRLTPIAAALALAIYLGLGMSAQSGTTSSVTVEEWFGAADASAESMLWESGVSAESVIETMLTGERAAGNGGTVDVR
jgi:anti-sigma factor RsiW